MLRTQWLVPYSVAGLIGILLAIGIAQYAIAEPSPINPGSSSEASELLVAFHRMERAYFDATVTGDASLLIGVAYNDSSVELLDEYQQMAEERREEVDRIVEASRGSLPVGAATGFLSAYMAEILMLDEQADAWEAEKESAAREGRNPSPDQLPDGYQPIERRVSAEWVDSDTHIHDVFVQGNRASATFSFGTPRKEGSLIHLTFINIEGTWYVTGLRSSGSG